MSVPCVFARSPAARAPLLIGMGHSRRFVPLRVSCLVLPLGLFSSGVGGPVPSSPCLSLGRSLPCGRACPGKLALRTVGAAEGRPGGGTSCLGVGHPGLGALPRPTPRPFSVRPEPATHWLWLRGQWAWETVTNPAAFPLACLLCVLWGGRRAPPGGGRLLLGCGTSGVERSPSPDCPSLGPAAGACYPLSVGARGSRRGETSPTPRHAPLQGGFARCGGSTRVLGAGSLLLRCGASGAGRPSTRYYPSLESGAGGPLLTGSGSHHQPHSVRSCYWLCTLSGRQAGAREKVPLAWVWHVRPGFATQRLWVRCADVGARFSLAHSPVPRFVLPCAGFPGLLQPVVVAGWHLSLCLGCGRRLAPLACLMAPRGAPRLVPSSGSRCSGRLPRRCGAFPHPGGSRPQIYWAAVRGTWTPAESRAHCACCWPLPRQGRWARSASYPFGALQWDCSWRVPTLVFG